MHSIRLHSSVRFYRFEKEPEQISSFRMAGTDRVHENGFQCGSGNVPLLLLLLLLLLLQLLLLLPWRLSMINEKINSWPVLFYHLLREAGTGWNTAGERARRPHSLRGPVVQRIDINHQHGAARPWVRLQKLRKRKKEREKASENGQRIMMVDAISRSGIKDGQEVEESNRREARRKSTTTTVKSGEIKFVLDLPFII